MGTSAPLLKRIPASLWGCSLQPVRCARKGNAARIIAARPSPRPLSVAPADESASRVVDARRVIANGVDFSVRVSLPEGSPGAPSGAVLCIPGALGTAASDFTPQLEAGLGRLAVVSFDPRGHGGSRPPERDYPPGFYRRDAEDAFAVMEALGFGEGFGLLGWSDGANAALLLAASRPESVRRLCVWGGNAYIEGGDVEAYEAVRDVRRTWSPRMKEERGRIFGGLEGLQAANDRATDAYGELLEGSFGDVCLSALHRIECETLVVHGRRDAICAEKHAEYIARNVRNSRLVMFEEVGHNLHLRHAGKFNALVQKFLEEGFDSSPSTSEMIQVRGGDSKCALDVSISTSVPDLDVGRIAYGFMASKALFVALRAGVFDAIAMAAQSSPSQTCSFEDIKKLSTVKGERLRTLLTANVALGLIRSQPSSPDELYSLPRTTRDQLCRGGKHFWGDYLTSQVEGQFYERMGGLHVAMALAEGSEEASDEGYEAWFDRDPSAAEQYTRAQHNGSLATAFGLMKKLGSGPGGSKELGAQTKSMLDVGGGSGAFCIAAARKLPSLEKAVVLDLPNVSKVASRIITEEETPEVARKIRCVGMSADRPGGWFSDPGPAGDSSGGILRGEFDVVLMSYVSGSIPAGALKGLYGNAFGALKPGGLAIVHDFIMDNDGRAPLNAALWALAHVSVNPEGCGLRAGRVVGLLEAAGFVAPKVQDMIRGMTQLITVRKPL